MSILTVKNLNVKENGKNILDDISFEREEKGVYAILGKGGSGKTALARALAGISDYEGEILYKDVELSQKGKAGAKLKAKIGYVPQKSFLYSDMTVYEALDFTARMRGVGADKRVRQIKEALELLEISRLNEALVGDLTPSDKKRVLFANALMGNPGVILLDEPTLAVNPDDAALIRELIAMLGERKTVIIFTEKILLANELARDIGIISKGKLELWSSLDDIKERLNGDPNALLKAFMAFS
ncbi:MAG: ABC transporter ATP-binding protein [Clostridia bacterium]|nr:ABC transporter ATP-binding protein [Clostridia bacterium]